MIIKSIKIENNNILGNIFLEFTDDSGEILNTIIIAGENGTGKSTILNIIYDFSIYKISSLASEEKRTFIIRLSKRDIEQLNSFGLLNSYLVDGIFENELEFYFDFSIVNDWEQVKILFKNLSGESKEIRGSMFAQSEVRSIFKAIFSDTEINFSTGDIRSVTAKDIDEEEIKSIKSSSNLASDITQLLIDIQSLDAQDFLIWGNKNIGKLVNKDMMDIRIRRFKQAFDFMFPTKKYQSIKNVNGFINVVFEEYGKEIPIDRLSSGEKQIVFRGSFLLKDQKSNKDILVLIDEPELSLHPNWQLKIIDFYKKLFTNEEGIQSSQIFFVTHSPFIVHNKNRMNDKVIILKKDENGKIFVLKDGKYYGWTDEQIIREAFNIGTFRNKISVIKKNLVITEGKTDWKHLKAALLKFRKEGKFIEDDFEFLEYENEIEMGDKDLISLCQQLSKLKNDYKVICVFDRDVTDTLKKIQDDNFKFKRWGNNVFSFAIPVPQHRKLTPSISIEHYYTDSELKLETGDGKRLYLGNEFSCKSGLYVDKDRFCIKKNKCGENSIKIIDQDCEVFMNLDESQNIALSKNQFATNILNGVPPFNGVGFNYFEEVFNIIREIISNDSQDIVSAEEE